MQTIQKIIISKGLIAPSRTQRLVTELFMQSNLYLPSTLMQPMLSYVVVEHAVVHLWHTTYTKETKGKCKNIF